MLSLKTSPQTLLTTEPAQWVVTGGAGFIGSHLVSRLLQLGQHVRVIDNFSTGYVRNLEDIRDEVGEAAWQNFRLLEGCITDPKLCAKACDGSRYILHQAALRSVPRSIAEPLRSHHSNLTGFLTLLNAAQQAGCHRFVYASSSAVYGDSTDLPKVEDCVGRPLSPYAANKAMNEMYAQVFAHLHGLEVVGLRYFNVFGPRQDPSGAYAAVIPRWISQVMRGIPCVIYGDGESSRDYCHVENVVQANLLAAQTPTQTPSVFNVAVGQHTSLRELHRVIVQEARRHLPGLPDSTPVFRDFRAGDIRHSLADISRIQQRLGYAPTVNIQQGLKSLVAWWADRDPQSPQRYQVSPLGRTMTPTASGTV